MHAWCSACAKYYVCKHQYWVYDMLVSCAMKDPDELSQALGSPEVQAAAKEFCTLHLSSSEAAASHVDNMVQGTLGVQDLLPFVGPLIAAVHVRTFAVHPIKLHLCSAACSSEAATAYLLK